ncbi:MAG: response regulator transcription factor [Vicinamibacteria bacterium]|nr:response regulator transcription factor [Vicinamibacteria bacterium]
MARALVVEDDPDIVELITHYLSREGWTVDATDNGRAALSRLRARDYALLILDLQLPGADGLSICSEVRRHPETRRMPIVIVTARADEADRIVGLEMGADDYVVKPFSPRELVARVRAVMRRATGDRESEDVFIRETIEIDRARHIVRRDGRPVHLTAKEFALLLALIDAHGRVLSRRQLLENVWGYSEETETRTVDVHIRRLREKLPELAAAIVTIKSLGYRFDASETRCAD